MDGYNEAAFENYNEKALEKCSGCTRTFNADALVRHQKMCLKGKTTIGSDANNKNTSFGASAQSNQNATSVNGNTLNWKAAADPKKPKALVCYICGREFGTASLPIHLKSCKKKWEDNEAQKPAH